MSFKLLSFFALISIAQCNVQPGDVLFFLTNANIRMQEIRSGQTGHLDLNRNADVKVLSHGWISDADTSWYAPTKNNYLAEHSRSNTTIIAVDWSRHATGLYSSAVNSIPDVGRIVGLMVLELSDTHNIPLSNFHLIGHSLGAHLSGVSGKTIFAERGETVARITGLDPAGLSWQGNSANDRLANTDAVFVDVLHTDRDLLGYRGSIGDLDYYPNGGSSRQNGCALLQPACSHNRAPIYFYESVLSDGFIAVRCNSESDFNSSRCNANHRTVMGENVDRSATGDYYLNTGSSYPFALGRL